MTDNISVEGPDFSQGVPLASLRDGEMLKGHVHGEPALLVRRGDEVFAIAPSCTHYGAPLEDGLLVGDTIRCPWHHACFSIRTGAVLRAPGLGSLQRWRVELSDGMILASEELEGAEPAALTTNGSPASVVIVGGGPSGYAAAATLRREGYAGAITIFSADEFLPCDRPNLSKGYLSGAAPDESNLLKPAEFYSDNRITVRLNAPVERIDVAHREIELADGQRYPYDALLLATGATPVRLGIPGADLPHVHYLRSLADSQALVEAIQSARRAVVIGASFIGLEVASSLRSRSLEVDVVGPERVLMAKALGPEVGRFLRRVHEDHGVTFHLGCTATRIDETSVTLDNGERIDADLVIIGIGVRPETGLAEAAGLQVDRGVVVNQCLETSEPGIFAAGDIARWPDPLSGERIRIEHFVVAERQGETAARNMLGQRESFAAIPFFWTEQYDLGIAYVGHAVNWDEAIVDGDLEKRDCSITYRRNGQKLAVAVIHRDLVGLEAEVEFEKVIASGAHQHDRGSCFRTRKAVIMGKTIKAADVCLKRAYEPASRTDGRRILVDRLWPRGISKAEAAIDEWLKNLAPTTKLRKWFGHDPDRWDEFQRRYANEIHGNGELLAHLRDLARAGPVTLVYSAHDEVHNDAVVLRDVLLGREGGES